MKPFDLSLYFVVDSSRGDVYSLVERAVRGGVTLVQLREKNLTEPEIKKIARPLLEFLKTKRIPLILNDHPQVAKEIGANGVHLGKKDMSPKQAREILGPDAIIGLSLESERDAASSDLSAVDYVAVSPVFETMSKEDAAFPLGLEGIRKIRSHTSLPLVAIGGIHAPRVKSVLQAGADGVAVVSAIRDADSPECAARELLSLIKRKTPSRVLTIAGSDSGGGAGIQADLKTFQALGCHGMSAITALTAQNTSHVSSIFPVSPQFVEDQIRAIVEDIGVDAVKIGMLFSKEIIQTVSRILTELDLKNIVVDPVMVAKSGDHLLQTQAIHALKECLFPLATLVTPNLPEAEVLTGKKIQSKEDMEKIALNFATNLLLKGGHFPTLESVDDLFCEKGQTPLWISQKRIPTQNTHGTGCTYSSAIAAYLARGESLAQSVSLARTYLQGAILQGSHWEIGKGSGPVDHFWEFRRTK